MADLTRRIIAVPTPELAAEAKRSKKRTKKMKEG